MMHAHLSRSFLVGLALCSSGLAPAQTPQAEAEPKSRPDLRALMEQERKDGPFIAYNRNTGELYLFPEDAGRRLQLRQNQSARIMVYGPSLEDAQAEHDVVLFSKKASDTDWRYVATLVKGTKKPATARTGTAETSTAAAPTFSGTAFTKLRDHIRGLSREQQNEVGEAFLNLRKAYSNVELLMLKAAGEAAQTEAKREGANLLEEAYDELETKAQGPEWSFRDREELAGVLHDAKMEALTFLYKESTQRSGGGGDGRGVSGGSGGGSGSTPDQYLHHVVGTITGLDTQQELVVRYVTAGKTSAKDVVVGSSDIAHRRVEPAHPARIVRLDFAAGLGILQPSASGLEARQTGTTAGGLPTYQLAATDSSTQVRELSGVMAVHLMLADAWPWARRALRQLNIDGGLALTAGMKLFQEEAYFLGLTTFFDRQQNTGLTLGVQWRSLLEPRGIPGQLIVGSPTMERRLRSGLFLGLLFRLAGTGN
jgi:hypothetical protein